MKHITICLVLACVAGLLASSVSSVRLQVQPVQKFEGLEAHENAAGATLLGQFRSTVASWLFLRADLYLHNGVQMRPLTNFEQQSGVKAQAAHESEEKIDEGEHLVTAIPDSKQDFRGVLGDLERATNSFKNMDDHVHNDPIATWPLYRLMTWADPHFIEGWTLGSTILAWQRNPASIRQAHEFLSEGLVENPNQLELLIQRCSLQIQYEKKTDDAFPTLLKAVQEFSPNFEKLTASERASLNEAYHWLIVILRAKSQQIEAKQYCQIGSTLWPEDPFFTMK